MTQKVKTRARLDQILVNKGLAESKTKAQAMIMAGEVYIGEEKQTKPGHKVLVSSNIQIKSVIPSYVSRGGLKLAGALEDFNVIPNNMLCLDVGASTGGFTDCLLKHGAQKVFCIDVGKNQLHYKLQNHPKVTWKESLHIKNFDPQKTFAPHDLKNNIDLVVVDCSFIAMERVIPHAISVLHAKSQILALIKPQFQAQAKDLKKGVIVDDELRKRLIENCVENIEKTLPLVCSNKSDSHIKGPKGNQECFVLFSHTN